MDTEGHILVDISFSPEWGHIAHVRRMVSALLAASSQDKDHADGVALAAHELLENAVKYGVGTAQLKVWVDVARGRAVRLSVSNTSRRPEDAETLATHVSSLRGGRGYLEAMDSSARSAGGPARLGLARIWYEAGLSLQCVRDGNQVTITAVPRDAQ